MAFNVNQVNQNTQYTKQKADIRLEHSALDMNSTDSSSGEVGKLIPVYVDELLPGQKVTVNQKVGIQFTPFVSNLYHELRGQVMSFFVPMRLLVDEWEEFITGGKDGEYSTPLPRLKRENFGVCIQPFTDRGAYAFISQTRNRSGATRLPDKGLIYSLWDYFGLPMSDIDSKGITKEIVEANPMNMWRAYEGGTTITIPEGVDVGIDFDVMPNAHFFKAYYKIWNDVLRMPDIDDEIPLGPTDNWNDLQLLRWYWPNDYFTRARIYQQRGVTPSIPVSPDRETSLVRFYGTASIGQTPVVLKGDDVRGIRFDSPGTSGFIAASTRALNGTFQLNDFLESLAIARYQFNNAKIQPRYIEHLKQRFHVDPQDYRIQLPEYLGNWRFSVNINTVTQMSESNKSPQGTMTAQGTAQNGGVLTYEAKEHGVIMSLMIIRPYSVYQQGLPKMFDRTTRFDFATPELANTPDVPITQGELFYSVSTGANAKVSSVDNGNVFGWKGIYDEYRTRINKVTGLLRTNLNQSLASYSLARYFDSPPALNKEFMRCNPDMDRVKALPDEPDFLFFFQNKLDSVLPIPYESQPAAFASL